MWSAHHCPLPNFFTTQLRYFFKKKKKKKLREAKLSEGHDRGNRDGDSNSFPFCVQNLN
jgi:hypothetical protein